MRKSNNPIILRLFLVLFLLCVILVFITEPMSPEFYVMILSSIINLIMIIIVIIRIRKEKHD